MTDRPAIFQAPMVRAMLDGRKTQTRRLSRRTTPRRIGGGHWQAPTVWQKVRAGDRLWVREALRWAEKDGCIYYRADDSRLSASLIPAGYAVTSVHLPSIFMPRWASRLTLVVTGVRRQRVQDISDADATAEGVLEPGWEDDVPGGPIYTGNVARFAFESLWDSIHKPGSRWADNPEVVALTFTAHQWNIDKEAA